MKGFDPLKNIDMFGNSKAGNDGLETGWKIATTISKTIAGGRTRRKMEEAEQRERERIEKTIAAPPPVHGSARWAKGHELSRAKLLRDQSEFDSPSSILLGVFPDHEAGGAIAGQIHWDAEGHLVTVAPTRSGKSTTTIVPNLVRYKGSCVVLDPKGELYEQTAAWRRSIGPVYRIAPFERDSDGFNPLRYVKTFADARALASLIMPADPKAQDFFRNDAIAFLTAVILFVAEHAPPEHRSLQEVRNITAGPINALTEFAEDMVATGKPVFANPASTVLGKRRESLSTLRDTFNSELAIWDDPEIANATSGDLDFKALKDGTATVYISVPFEKMEAYASFLKVVLTAALDAMTIHKRLPEIPVLFILDEFLSLGPFPQFKDAIRTHAGAGVRLWFFLQDMATLEEHYPKSWSTFMNAAVKLFFGTNDAVTGRSISENLLGNTTVGYFSGSVQQGGSSTPGDIFHHSHANNSVNASVNLAQKPLLNGTEVVSLLAGKLDNGTRHGILSLSDMPHPIQLRMVPWFLGEKCRARVTSNR